MIPATPPVRLWEAEYQKNKYGIPRPYWLVDGALIQLWERPEINRYTLEARELASGKERWRVALEDPSWVVAHVGSTTVHAAPNVLPLRRHIVAECPSRGGFLRLATANGSIVGLDEEGTGRDIRGIHADGSGGYVILYYGDQGRRKIRQRDESGRLLQTLEGLDFVGAYDGSILVQSHVMEQAGILPVGKPDSLECWRKGQRVWRTQADVSHQSTSIAGEVLWTLDTFWWNEWAELPDGGPTAPPVLLTARSLKENGRILCKFDLGDPPKRLLCGPKEATAVVKNRLVRVSTDGRRLPGGKVDDAFVLGAFEDNLMLWAQTDPQGKAHLTCSRLASSLETLWQIDLETLPQGIWAGNDFILCEMQKLVLFGSR